MAFVGELRSPWLQYQRLISVFSPCPDPTTNLSDIQEVSDLILKAKLPLNLATLKRKLEDLKNLAANLPDSTSVLEDAEPQLEKARELLEEAQEARWDMTESRLLFSLTFALKQHFKRPVFCACILTGTLHWE